MRVIAGLFSACSACAIHSWMKIALTHEQIVDIARRHSADNEDVALLDRMKSAVLRKYMTMSDLVEVARWKWRGARTRQLCEKNSAEDVEEITRASFAANSERLRIGALLSLHGVGWPMASVILHFSFPDRYPILDARAMKTVGGSTIYNFERWMDYTELCRSKAKQFDVPLRVLDKALWGFDKDGD